jgi:hypothetical protein
VITYQTEKTHIKTDALTRRSSDRSKSEKDDRQRHQHQLILTLNKLNFKVRDEMNIAEIIEQDKFEASTISKIISNEADVSEEKIFVSKKKRLQIIKEIHD